LGDLEADRDFLADLRALVDFLGDLEAARLTAGEADKILINCSVVLIY
jgi:hypothetical protein